MRWVKDFLLQLGLSWPPHAPLAAKCILERATQSTLRERFHFLALYLSAHQSCYHYVKKGRAQSCAHEQNKRVAWGGGRLWITMQH